MLSERRTRFPVTINVTIKGIASDYYDQAHIVIIIFDISFIHHERDKHEDSACH
jgi:hypothetical protein